MRIPFKFDRKIFWTSLLFLIFFVAIIIIIQNLYHRFIVDDQNTSTVIPSKSDLVSDQQQNIEENKIEGLGLPVTFANGNPLSNKESAVELITKLTDESNVAMFLVDELNNIRDPFQEVIKAEEENLSTSSQSEFPVPSTPGDLSMVDLLDTNVIYQDLYEAAEGDETVVEQEPEIVEQPLEYPAFLLKGVVSKGGRKKALIITEDQSYIVSTGEQVQTWNIETIDQNWIRVVNQDDQKFILTLEGMVMDESSE